MPGRSKYITISAVAHTFGNLKRKFIKLLTLCCCVCPAMHCRMGEEGSCPAQPVQIYQWFKLLESCKGSLLNPSPFQGCALCMCVCHTLKYWGGGELPGPAGPNPSEEAPAAQTHLQPICALWTYFQKHWGKMSALETRQQSRSNILSGYKKTYGSKDLSLMCVNR